MARRREKPADPIAAAVIDALGGDTVASKELGIATSTISSWKTNGIPGWRRDKIIETADRLRAQKQLKHELPPEFVRAA